MLSKVSFILLSSLPCVLNNSFPSRPCVLHKYLLNLNSVIFPLQHPTLHFYGNHNQYYFLNDHTVNKLNWRGMKVSLVFDSLWAIHLLFFSVFLETLTQGNKMLLSGVLIHLRNRNFRGYIVSKSSQASNCDFLVPN